MIGANQSSGFLRQSADGAPDFGFNQVGRATVNDICVFSDTEIFLASVANENSMLAGGVSGRLELIGADGKPSAAYNKAFPLEGGDVYTVVKESDSTVLIAGEMLEKIVNGTRIIKGIARMKKRS